MFFTLSVHKSTTVAKGFVTFEGINRHCPLSRFTLILFFFFIDTFESTFLKIYSAAKGLKILFIVKIERDLLIYTPKKNGSLILNFHVKVVLVCRNKINMIIRDLMELFLKFSCVCRMLRKLLDNIH